MIEYTRFRNKNRGYMKLRVWHKAVELYKLVCRIVYTDNKIDFKLRAQIADAAQSVSSNISEGYSRRSIHEYNLWRLLESLEKKRDEGSWVTRATENIDDHHPQEPTTQ